MKILFGYLLTIALLVGVPVAAFQWLSAEPETTTARKAVAKVVVARAEAEPAKAVEEVVTFPEAPPRPALVADTAIDQSPQTPALQTKATIVPSGPSPTSAFARFQPEPKAAVRTAKKKKTAPRYEVMIQRTMQTPDGRIVRKLIPLSRKEADAYAQYR